MKIKNTITVLLFAFILASCAPKALVIPRADNFSFIFQDYSCASIPVNVLNTMSGTLVHTPLDDTTSITIPLHLNDDELEAIYQKSISIDFFDYPSKFIVPADQALGYEEPASSYQLSITNGKMTKSVSWTDDAMTKPSYTKADQLRELINLINETLRSRPEFQQLPEPIAQCL